LFGTRAPVAREKILRCGVALTRAYSRRRPVALLSSGDPIKLNAGGDRPRGDSKNIELSDQHRLSPDASGYLGFGEPLPPAAAAGLGLAERTGLRLQAP
jgi:hypothetical protein